MHFTYNGKNQKCKRGSYTAIHCCVLIHSVMLKDRSDKKPYFRSSRCISYSVGSPIHHFPTLGRGRLMVLCMVIQVRHMVSVFFASFRCRNNARGEGEESIYRGLQVRDRSRIVDLKKTERAENRRFLKSGDKNSEIE